MENVLIIGVGNVLQSDDGAGSRVVEYLETCELPPEVAIFDGGTAIIALLDVIAGRPSLGKMIVVDAVQGGGEAGSIYRFAPEDAESGFRPLTSVHQIGLLEMLAMAQHLGCRPEEVVILGVEPKVIGWGQALSPEVAAAVPQIAALALAEARLSLQNGER